jgi:hypothetical protein
MKTKTFSLIELLTVIVIVAVLGILTTPRACAQVDAFTVTALTPSTNSVATNSIAAVTTPAIPVRGSEGVGFVAKFKLGAADTNNVVFKYDVSADGTNWTTTQPFSSGNIPANGTNSVVQFFTFTPTTTPPLRNVNYIRLGTVQNANTATNAAVTIENLWSTKYNR